MSPPAVILGASLVWFAAIMTPGPNFIMVSQLALSRSRPTALAAAFGIATGAFLYAALTMFGLSVLFLRFEWLGNGMRILGACYLVWLGVQTWRSRTDGPVQRDASDSLKAQHDVWFGYRTGLLTDMTNLKGIAFFIGLFAAAVPVSTPLWAKWMLLGSGVVMDVFWYGLVGLALSAGPARKIYQRMQRQIDGAFAILLIVVGLKLAIN
jgi:threonine efflux protein